MRPTGDQTAKLFHFVMIKPTHYDDDGYPIQWFRSAIPSNTLACLNALAEDARKREVLGSGVEMRLHTYDETNRRVRPDKIIDMIRREGGRALIGLVGVQSNQFPRAVDLARPFLDAGLPVSHRRLSCVGLHRHAARTAGRHQSRAGHGHLLIRRRSGGAAARRGAVRCLERRRSSRSTITWTTCRSLPASRRRSCRRSMCSRTSGSLSSIDLGRGCPYQCSFCTIINVQGRKSRIRSADDLEHIVRENYAAGHQALLHHRRQFRPQQGLGALVRPHDRNAGRREDEYRLHHPGRHALPQDPGLHREGDARRRAPRLHRAGEHQSRQPDRRQEAAEQDHRISRDAADVAQPRRHHLCRLHPRLPGRHQGLDPARHRDHQARTADRHPRVLLPHAAAGLGGPQGACRPRASGWTRT